MILTLLHRLIALLDLPVTCRVAQATLPLSLPSKSQALGISRLARTAIPVPAILSITTLPALTGACSSTLRISANTCGINPFGAAYAAGLAVGFWKRPEELRANWQMDKTWTPQMKPAERARRIAGWKKAITRSFNWVEPETTRD